MEEKRAAQIEKIKEKEKVSKIKKIEAYEQEAVKLADEAYDKLAIRYFFKIAQNPTHESTPETLKFFENTIYKMSPKARLRFLCNINNHFPFDTTQFHGGGRGDVKQVEFPEILLPIIEKHIDQAIAELNSDNDNSEENKPTTTPSTEPKKPVTSTKSESVPNNDPPAFIDREINPVTAQIHTVNKPAQTTTTTAKPDTLLKQRITDAHRILLDVYSSLLRQKITPERLKTFENAMLRLHLSDQIGLLNEIMLNYVLPIDPLGGETEDIIKFREEILPFIEKHIIRIESESETLDKKSEVSQPSAGTLTTPLPDSLHQPPQSTKSEIPVTSNKIEPTPNNNPPALIDREINPVTAQIHTINKPAQTTAKPDTINTQQLENLHSSLLNLYFAMFKAEGSPERLKILDDAISTSTPKEQFGFLRWYLLPSINSLENVSNASNDLRDKLLPIIIKHIETLEKLNSANSNNSNSEESKSTTTPSPDSLKQPLQSTTEPNQNFTTELEQIHYQLALLHIASFKDDRSPERLKTLDNAISKLTSQSQYQLLAGCLIPRMSTAIMDSKEDEEFTNALLPLVVKYIDAFAKLNSANNNSAENKSTTTPSPDSLKQQSHQSTEPKKPVESTKSESVPNNNPPALIDGEINPVTAQIHTVNKPAQTTATTPKPADTSLAESIKDIKSKLAKLHFDTLLDKVTPERLKAFDAAFSKLTPQERIGRINEIMRYLEGEDKKELHEEILPIFEKHISQIESELTGKTPNASGVQIPQRADPEQVVMRYIVKFADGKLLEVRGRKVQFVELPPKSQIISGGHFDLVDSTFRITEAVFQLSDGKRVVFRGSDIQVAELSPSLKIIDPVPVSIYDNPKEDAVPPAVAVSFDAESAKSHVDNKIVEDCDRPWAMTSDSLYGMFPADWKEETVKLPEFIVKLTTQDLSKQLARSISGDGEDFKSACNSILSLKSKPMSSVWFEIEGGRLKSDLKYKLSSKGEMFVRLLKTVKQSKSEKSKDQSKLAEKTLEKIGFILDKEL
ncbi:MAG: hypothetical protein LBB88_07720, partial [Planctomycetaceae bacterium]|jgi:hypothetical protein|nr:hypothetical protein [Planctomycetaceae bacterium]